MIKYYRIKTWNIEIYFKKIKAKHAGKGIIILMELRKANKFNCKNCTEKNCPFSEIKNKNQFNVCLRGINTFRYYLVTKLLKRVSQLDYLLKG